MAHPQCVLCSEDLLYSPRVATLFTKVPVLAQSSEKNTEIKKALKS